MCGLDNIKANKMQTVSRVHIFEQLQKKKKKSTLPRSFVLYADGRDS